MSRGLVTVSRKTLSLQCGLNSLAMSEDEEPEPLDFEEFMETVEENRRERKQQVSYEWVEKVREAGELYRDYEDFEIVSEALNEPEEVVQEALTVYRLIFEEQMENVASKASDSGRAFFSTERHAGSTIDDDEDEPLEELLREYVGAFYLEYDIDEEPVGQPPENSTPPPPVDFSEIVDIVNQGISFPIESIVANSAARNIGETVKEIRAMMYPSIGEIIAQQEQLTDLIWPVFAENQRVVNSLAATNLTPLIEEMQRQQIVLNDTVANAITGIQLPEPVLADIPSLQLDIRAPSVASPVSTSRDRGGFATAEATSTVETEPSETTPTSVPSPDPTTATTVSPLPDSDVFTTELVFEISPMLVEAMLSTGQARSWFTNLSDEIQITVVNVLLVAVAFHLTGSLALAALAPILAPAVRHVVAKE